MTEDDTPQATGPRHRSNRWVGKTHPRVCGGLGPVAISVGSRMGVLEHRCPGYGCVCAGILPELGYEAPGVETSTYVVAAS
jgi:hypothetical protein